MDFEEVDCGLDVGPVALDGVLELGLPVDEAVVLVGEVSRELGPAVGLLLLDVPQRVLGLHQLLSQLVQQLQDPLDGLLVHLRGQLGQGRDQGL